MPLDAATSARVDTSGTWAGCLINTEGLIKSHACKVRVVPLDAATSARVGTAGTWAGYILKYIKSKITY